MKVQIPPAYQINRNLLKSLPYQTHLSTENCLTARHYHPALEPLVWLNALTCSGFTWTQEEEEEFTDSVAVLRHG